MMARGEKPLRWVLANMKRKGAYEHLPTQENEKQ
jgi:hypothetical protein